MALTTAKQRDFVRQMISIATQNEARISATGFDINPRLQSLTTKAESVDQAEALQKKAQAEALEATEKANKLLTEAYAEASALVEFLAGSLGKNDALVSEIRKMRKMRSGGGSDEQVKVG